LHILFLLSELRKLIEKLFNRLEILYTDSIQKKTQQIKAAGTCAPNG